MPESWPDLARALVAEMVGRNNNFDINIININIRLKIIVGDGEVPTDQVGTMFLVLIGCGAAVNWKTSFDVTQANMIMQKIVLMIGQHYQWV